MFRVEMSGLTLSGSGRTFSSQSAVRLWRVKNRRTQSVCLAPPRVAASRDDRPQCWAPFGTFISALGWNRLELRSEGTGVYKRLSSRHSQGQNV